MPIHRIGARLLRMVPKSAASLFSTISGSVLGIVRAGKGVVEENDTPTLIAGAIVTVAALVTVTGVEVPKPSLLDENGMIGAVEPEILTLFGASAAAIAVLWLSSKAEKSRSTSMKAGAAAGGIVAVGMATATGAISAILIDPVAMLAGLVGDVVVTGAMAGFAAITGLVGAASGKVMGASRKGTAAAGTIGVVSGGMIAAAAVPATFGAGAIGLTIVTDNPVYAALFGAAIVFFITDSLANIGDFSANLAFAIRIATVATLSVIVASQWLGVELSILGDLGV